MEPRIDVLSPRFYLDSARETYRWLRDHRPVAFDEKNGLWALARYGDVRRAEREPQTFSNAGGSRPETGPLPWMIDMDSPEHGKRRQLVARGFSVARVRAIEPRLEEICDDLIDRVAARGECDFVADIAAPLPMVVIGDMLGVPSSDRAKLLEWTHVMLASLSGEPAGVKAAAEAFGAWVEYAHSAITTRRDDPRDDLFSVLVHAEIDGERLDDDEIVMEALLLLIGGDETTRQVASGGLEQLLSNPKEWDALRREPTRIGTTIEEMLRWVSPIKSMARTTTGTVDVAGVQIPAGAKVVLLYESANFDERQFADPGRFDAERTPNDHLAFGSGPHLCLGASLARAELRALLGCVVTRLPDLRLETDEPLPRSMTGIDRMPVAFTSSAV